MLIEADADELDRYLARKADEDEKSFLSAGDRIACWRVTGLLGRGGSGEVYRVVHAETGQAAAAKVLVRGEQSAANRFREEVAFLAANKLPQFPRFYSEGQIKGRPCFVMELLEPIDVPSSEKGIASYLLEVCACVRALHLSGLVHRDLKPKNIMRRPGGTRFRASVVLIDFGLAKDVMASPNPRAGISIISDKPVCAGTPEYAAPEQMTGGEVSQASDIHALGRIANSAFHGNPPRKWREIIRRSTSSIPEQRYPSVDEFAAAIRHRNRAEHYAKCSVALMVLVVGVILAWHMIRRTPEEIAWDRLCDEAVATNVVRQELIEVKWLDMNGVKIPAERRYRLVTNRVEVVRVELGGVTNVFANPVRLKGGIEYWVTGPGVLDGTFLAEGTNVTMRIRDCIMRNHAAEPLDKVGINYDLQDGAGLDLPELDEPDDHGRHRIECSGSPTRLTFKGTGLAKSSARAVLEIRSSRSTWNR